MVHIKEASRTDLALRMIAAAARDHGPAVFVLRDSPEHRVIADLIVEARLPLEPVVEEGADAERLRGYMARAYDYDVSRIRAADTLASALFGKQAIVAAARTTPAKPVPPYDYNDTHGVLVFNPLGAWRDEHLHEYIAANEIATPDEAQPAYVHRIAA